MRTTQHNPFSFRIRFCSYSWLFPALFILGFNSCSLLSWPIKTEQCKIQTYTNAGVLDYINSRFDTKVPPRVAVFPFDVPETFAPPGDSAVNFGHELAKSFHAELFRSGEVGIIELLQADRWPGKREEFFKGNYEAIRIARDAGFDLVVLGYMEDLKNADTISVDTKVIDVTTGISLWFARSAVSSNRRDLNLEMSKLGVTNRQPELFYFPERVQELSECTVSEMLGGKPVP